MSQPEGAYQAPEVLDDRVEKAPEEAARIGPVGRFFGTLFSPGETFQDINRKPTWLVPMLIGIAFSTLFGWFVTTALDDNMREFLGAAIRKQIEGSGAQPLPPDRMAEQINVTVTFYQVLFRYAAIVMTPLYYLLIAGIFALGMLFLQAQTTFKKILSVVAWSSCAVSAVYTLVAIASVLIQDEEGRQQINPLDPAGLAATNPALFLPDASPVVKALVGSLDIFTIWSVILFSIGLAAVGGKKSLTTGKTATLVGGLWAFWIVMKTVMALAFGA